MIFFLYFLKNSYPFSRFAVSVSSRVGNSVQRNYMKRKMREWFRARQLQFAPPTDIWVSIKKPFSRDNSRLAESVFSELLQKMAHP